MALSKSSMPTDHIPLQQGLRRLIESRTFEIMQPTDHIPLQQGLRHNYLEYKFITSKPTDHIPLQQGLRLGEMRTED